VVLYANLNLEELVRTFEVLVAAFSLALAYVDGVYMIKVI